VVKIVLLFMLIFPSGVSACEDGRSFSCLGCASGFFSGKFLIQSETRCEKKVNSVRMENSGGYFVSWGEGLDENIISLCDPDPKQVIESISTFVLLISSITVAVAFFYNRKKSKREEKLRRQRRLWIMAMSVIWVLFFLLFVFACPIYFPFYHYILRIMLFFV
jgi:hypothetical protein